MKEQLKMVLMKKVESPDNPGKVMYLPHHTVIYEDHSPTKLGVAFYANAKKGSPCWNNAIYKGSCLTPLSFDALPGFRLNLIGIIGDIENTYLQVSVADS